MIRKFFNSIASAMTGKAAKPEHPRSPHWPAVRAEHLKLCPTCAACGGAKNLQVHHITPFEHDRSLELKSSNLLTLCEHPNRNCHLRIGHSFDFHFYNPHSVEDAALSFKRIREREAI